MPNQKVIGIAVFAVIIIALGIFAYFKFFGGGKEAQDKALKEKMRQESVEAELKLTVVEPVVTDIIARLKNLRLADQEIILYRDGIKKLMEVAPLMKTIYQKQIGTSADARVAAVTDADRELFDRYGHPWGLSDTSELCVADPNFPPRRSGVIPDGLSCDIANKIGSPFEAIVKLDSGELKAVPYAEVFAPELLRSAVYLREASVIFKQMPREEKFAKYLSDLAVTFESKEPYPYAISDASWVDALTSESLLFARIGADEVGGDGVGDACESKARFHFNLGLISKEAGKIAEALKPSVDRFEKQFSELINDPANYIATPIQVEMPVFLDVIYANGDDVGGPGGTPIGQTLPNWCGSDGKGDCKHGTMIYVNKTLKAYNEDIMKKYIMPLFAGELQQYFNSAKGLDSVVYHELFHNLGPRDKKKKPGSEKTYGETLTTSAGESWKSALEELKAQTGSLYMAGEFYKDAVAKHEGGEIDDAKFAEETKNFKEHILYDMAWSFRMILRGSRPGPEFKSRNPYARLATVQIGILVEEGALKFDEAKKTWDIDFSKMPSAVTTLTKKVGQLYVKADADEVEKMFLNYMQGGGEKLLHRDHLLETAREMPSVLFNYQLKGLE